MFPEPHVRAVGLDCAPSLPTTFTDVISSDPQVHPMGMLVVPTSEMTQCPGAGGRVSMGVFLMRLLKPRTCPGHRAGLSHAFSPAP